MLNEKNKYRTLDKQLIMRCMILIVIIFIISWLINAFFLETFYIKNKTNKLLLIYEELNSFDYNAYVNSDDSEVMRELDSFAYKLDALCSKYNVNFIVTDEFSNVKLTSISNPSHFKHFIGDKVVDEKMQDVIEIIDKQEKYTISYMRDAIDLMEYTVLWGTLDNGDLVMIRIAIEGTKADVKITNAFMFFISIGAIIFAAISLSFISSRIMKPIAELTEISEKMADLNFDAKYTGKYNNEIDVLGENLNHLSQTLEDTIGRLKSANEELQKDVEEKTKIDNMRKEFLANVSHELKTPIALIQGYAEGLKEGINDDPENNDFYCDVIMDETSKMNKMVKQLMQLNQLEFGMEELTLVRFNITELLENFIQANSILAKEKNIVIQFENCVGELEVLSDEFLIGEVLRNYYNNAINHVDENRIIRITLAVEAGKAKVKVFNTGEIIPEEAIANLWDKFYKVDKARTREYGGSGIGLSIVKATMEMLNGEYGMTNIENDADKGVEFWFALQLD